MDVLWLAEARPISFFLVGFHFSFLLGLDSFVSHVFHVLILFVASGLLKKLGLRQEESSTSDQAGLVNRAQDDASNRINGVCVQMMQQLCLAHNVKQVQGVFPSHSVVL